MPPISELHIKLALTNNTSQSRAGTRLRHSYALSPITALAFYEAGPDCLLLLAGEDTFLKVYNVHSSRELGQLKVFYSQPIHGIYVLQGEGNSSDQENGILIWGGQSVTFLPRTILQVLIDGESAPRPDEFKAPDWIYDGILFSSAEINGALVTAHNEILPFSFSPDGRSLVFGPLTSPSRPILYSANLCLLSPGVVLVAGGTVFGEIIVWKYYADSSRPSQWEVLHVFTGHEGSIFGVSISPEIDITPGVKVRLLASCSDDRTIRVWDITDRPLAITASNGIDRKTLAEARETGFGGNSEAKRENRNDSSRCLAVAMGHVSRIWHVKFSGRINHFAPDPHPVEVYSFGEDCSRQKWELSLDPKRWQGPSEPESGDTIGTLQHCGADICHSGKSIWAAATLSIRDQEPLVATGGADGKIVVAGKLRSANSSQAYQDLDLSLTFDDVSKSLQGAAQASIERQMKKTTKHAFQHYAFLSDHKFLATKASGRLFAATFVGGSLVWEEIALPESIVSDLGSYHVVKSPAKGTALIGTTSGRLYLYQEGHDVRELAQFRAKISDIVLLESSPQHSPEGQAPAAWSVVITVLGSDHALLLHFNPSTNTSTIDPRRIMLPEHYIVTSAAFCASTLILGSRTGFVTAYITSASAFTPLASRKDAKTKDAITCIVPLPGSSSTSAATNTGDSRCSFLATCRDGKYRIYTLLPLPSGEPGGQQQHHHLQLQHEISAPLHTIESAFFTTITPAPSKATATTTTTLPRATGRRKTRKHQQSHLVLHGFQGKDFVAHDATARATLARVPCGGAHRPLAVTCGRGDPAQLSLVWSRPGDGSLAVHAQAAAPQRVLGSNQERDRGFAAGGGHGREVKAVAAAFSSSSSSSSSFVGGDGDRDGYGYGHGHGLIATGAEDTAIRLWKLRSRWSGGRVGNNEEEEEEEEEGMECLAVVEGHSAGIQALRWFGPGRLISSAGSEELFVWRVARLAPAAVREEEDDDKGPGDNAAGSYYDALGVVREAVWDDKTAEGDLRIVDLDVAPWAGSTGAGGGTMLLSLVLSDSSLRSYVYSPPPNPDCSGAGPAGHRGGRFEMLASGRYTGACPTQVRHLRADAASGELHVLAAYTDGHVAVWRTSRRQGEEEEAGQEQGQGQGQGQFELVLTAKLHQSSIKSLDLSAAGGSARWLVVTGGDDNALCVLDLAREGAGYSVLGRYRAKDAHAAAITGVCTVRQEESESIEVATVSNDQRVKLWKIERKGDGRGVRVALLDNRYSSVADAGDLELIAPDRLMVGGVGLEVWDLPDDQIDDTK